MNRNDDDVRLTAGSKSGQTPKGLAPPLPGPVLAALAAVAGFAAVYASMTVTDNATVPLAPAPKEAVQPPPKAAPTAPLAAFVKAKVPAAVPDLTFETTGKQPVKLSDFKGRVVLLNLWATWCAPCREEMPALDRLQRDLGSDKFEVVALSLDRAGADASLKYLNEVGAKNLKLYADPTGKQGFALKIPGMPTTLLIDKEGREVGRLTGPAEWDSADAKALIEQTIAQ